jgi:homocysteine S-methyltransferase
LKLLLFTDTGEYFVPTLEDGISKKVPTSLQELQEFHYSRLHTIAASSAWVHIDVIAFETVPRLDEAIAIRNAMMQINASYPRKMAYISFVFPKGKHLPWPSRKDESDDEDMEHLLTAVLGDDEQGQRSPLDGVGINCTKPKYLASLVQNMTAALPLVKRERKPYLFVSRK